MTIYETILAAYPELTEKDFGMVGSIKLQDDADGEGVYIAEWNYDKPIPSGLKLGK
jgi:hypothetical protein